MKPFFNDIARNTFFLIGSSLSNEWVQCTFASFQSLQTKTQPQQTFFPFWIRPNFSDVSQNSFCLFPTSPHHQKSGKLGRIFENSRKFWHHLFLKCHWLLMFQKATITISFWSVFHIEQMKRRFVIFNNISSYPEMFLKATITICFWNICSILDK